MDNRIKVGIRVRPLSEMEQQSSSSPSPVICEQGNQRITVGLDNRNRSSFAFDWCYSPASPSGSVYEQMCLPLINKVFEGYHATFFAYGQTGSGKTFTMGNSPESSDGIIQFAVNDIFEKRKAFQQAGKQVTIEVSYMEIYMEECYDLLSTVGEKKKVDVRENSRGETYVDSLTQRLVHTPEDFASCISHACRVRSVSKTAMNSHSSRSHAICTITVRVVTEDDTVVAKLNLVDLAGSERAKKTMASGDTLQEGININKGLLALGNVVSALSTKSKQMDNNNNNNKTQANGKPVAGSTHIHVPYRESKLTRLLKDSLGGNGMTALLACVSPAPTNQDETINTLRFASRASSIVNVAKVNHEEKTDAHVLNQEVNRLRAQLSALQEKYDDLHKAKAPALAARSSSTQQSFTSAAAAADVTDLLSGSSRLTTSFKSLVMHCFMEDVGIDDEVLQKLKEDLTTSAGLFGCEFVEEEENKLSESILEDCEISGLMDLEGLDGFNCVPPIAKVLDRLTNLETHLKKSLNRAAAAAVGVVSSSNKGRVRVSDGSTGSATSVASGVDAEGEEASSKELMLSAIMDDSDLGLGDDVSLDVSGDLSLSPIHKSTTSTGGGLSKALACNQPSTAMALVDAECPSQDAAASDVSSDALEESFERQVVQLDQMQTKFVKLTHLGHHYEHMIRKLNDEIHVLQGENNRLADAPATTAATTATAFATVVPEKVKNDLRLKSKELEEKVKLLRKKEMEMQKILTTKERLAQQLDQKQEQIQTYKKDKVKLMKKMQEKEVAHRQETKVFVKNDVQARQRAVRAEANAAKLTRDLSSRERFWQSKLDAKKIEMERLKTLLQKREEVQKMRGAMNGGGRFGAATAAEDAAKKMMLLHGAGAWNKHLDWKKKLQEIIVMENKLAKCNGAMQFYLHKKRGLQQDRIGVKQKMRKLRQSSPVYKELEEECKILDAGIATASQTIAQWQVKLSDLEANLAGISGGGNGNGGGLLTGGVAVTAAAGAAAGSALTTTTGVAAAAKTMTFKDFLQALMSSAPAQEGKEEWKTCLQTVWEHYRQTLQSLHQVQSEVQDLHLHEMDLAEDDGGDGGIDRSNGSLSHKSRKSHDNGDADDDDEDDDDAGSGLDDTFYPSEDEADAGASDFDDDDDDSDGGYAGKRGQKRRAGGAKKPPAKKGKTVATAGASKKKNATAKRSFEEMDNSGSSGLAEDSDASDSDASDSDNDEDAIAPKTAKRARVVKFSFAPPSGDGEITDTAAAEDHALLLFVRNNITSVEDILANPTYYTLALSLYDTLPALFAFAKREKASPSSMEEEASSSSSSSRVMTLLTPSMDYKKAFTSIDAWKQHFPLRTIKLREEAWTKLKNALVLFFAACTMAQSTVSGDVFVKVTGPPEAAAAAASASSLSLDHEQVAACLAGLKLKDAGSGTAGAKKVTNATAVPPAEDMAAVDPVAAAAEEEKWSKYTVKDLKTLLSDRGLPVSGTKKDLVSRIVSYELRNASNTKPLTDDASADSDSRQEAMDVDDVDAEAAASTDRPEQTKQQPLRDRTNYLKSLNELTTSAAAFATSAAAGTVTLSNHGISKRTFRLNLDELTEELENRPAPASTSVAVQDL